jgi:hypothetical protein
MTTGDRVDVSEPTEDARLVAERQAEDDPVYAELMCTYVELGELLDSHGDGSEYEAQCRELMDRSVALDHVLQRDYDQARALTVARWERGGDGVD